MQRVMQETVDGVSQLFGLGSAAIYMRDEDNVRLAATFPPLPPDVPDELRLEPAEEHSFLAATMRTRQPVLVPNVWNETLTSCSLTL